MSITEKKSSVLVCRENFLEILPVAQITLSPITELTQISHLFYARGLIWMIRQF